MDFCALTGLTRSVLYDWRKREKSGMLDNKNPGRKGGWHHGFMTKERLEAYYKRYGGYISNYCLARLVGVSESTARRFTAGLIVNQPRGSGKKPDNKSVSWLKLNTCWSADTMYVRVSEGRAYMMIMIEECSRSVLSVKLVRKIDGNTTAGFIRDTIYGTGQAPFLLKFDRGREFNNSMVMDLLTKENIMPMFSPRRYPKFNGRIERINKMFRGRLKQLGVKSFDETRDEIEKEAFFMNEKLEWRIFNGRTSNSVYANSEFVRETDRKNFMSRIKKQMKSDAKLKTKRMDMKDVLRKAADKTAVSAGLVYINNKLPDEKLPGLNMRELVRRRGLNIRVIDGYDRYSPDADILDAVKAEWNASPVRELIEKLKIKKV